MRGSVGRNKTIINCQVMSRESDASYIPNFKDADGSNSILQTYVYIFVWGKSKKHSDNLVTNASLSTYWLSKEAFIVWCIVWQVWILRFIRNARQLWVVSIAKAIIRVGFVVLYS